MVRFGGLVLDFKLVDYDHSMMWPGMMWPPPRAGEYEDCQWPCSLAAVGEFQGKITESRSFVYL